MEYLKEGSMTAELSAEIVRVETQIEELKLAEQNLKEKLKEAMKKAGIVKLENDELTITYIAPTTQERIDSKELKKDLPQIYNTYCKIQNKSDYITIKIKE